MAYRAPPPNSQHSVLGDTHVLIKGRGSSTNEDSRYLTLKSVAEDDGWSAHHDEDQHSKMATQYYADRTKRLITQNQSPDIPFEHSINPYKGCEHGCVYCFARPTHAYLDLSPGLDFETKIFYKTGVKERLTEAFRKPKYQCTTLAIGTNTDPYQPLEQSKRVMREVLEVLLEHRHPVSIVTKSALILRDLDLLSALAAQHLVAVNISVTTLDNDLKTKLEPRTAGPAARLKTIARLRAAGVPTGAMVAPVIPFINDREVEAIVEACAAAGAQTLAYILIRLPLEVAPLFEQWLEDHYPLKAQRVMSAIAQCRGGKAYRSEWHTRMVGEGEIAQLLGMRFRQAVAKAGLAGAQLPSLRTDLFTPPVSDAGGQLKLF